MARAGFDFFERLERAAVASMKDPAAAKDFLRHRAAGIGPEDSRACIEARYYFDAAEEERAEEDAFRLDIEDAAPRRPACRHLGIIERHERAAKTGFVRARKAGG